MKTINILTVLLFTLVSQVLAQTPQTPYYDIIGNVGVPANGSITRESLSTCKFSIKLNVPNEVADSITGFNIGFGIEASVREQGVELDSVQITNCRYSIFHLNATTNSETPVLLVDNTPATNIVISTFGSEGGQPTPSVFTANFGSGRYDGTVNSPSGSTINTPVQNVGGIFVTKHDFVFGSSSDFTQPTLNNGYVVRWTISFIPVHKGITYPEVTLHPTFTYKVKDGMFPKLVKLAGLSETYPNWGSEDGTVLQMTGDDLEYFKLQRSDDCKIWTDWTFEGEGCNWINYNIPSDGGYYPSTFEWIMFDKTYPNERRRAPKEFYRMVWTGQRDTWRIWSDIMY